MHSIPSRSLSLIVLLLTASVWSLGLPASAQRPEHAGSGLPPVAGGEPDQSSGAPPAPEIVSVSACTWRQFDQGAVAGGGVEVHAAVSETGGNPLRRWEFAVVEVSSQEIVASRVVGAIGGLEAATTLVGLDFGTTYAVMVRAGNPHFGPWSLREVFASTRSNTDC